MLRKQFTTTIDQELQTKFKEKCSCQNQKMNDVLELLMDSYITGDFTITKKLNFSKR